MLPADAQGAVMLMRYVGPHTDEREIVGIAHGGCVTPELRELCEWRYEDVHGFL
jgi:hypothetical protein